MTKLTKKKDGDAWRVYANGKPTALIIEKGAPAKYGHTQMYDVVDSVGDAYCFEAKGVAVVMGVLERLFVALSEPIQ